MLCFHVGVPSCHSVHVEIREQLWESVQFFYLWILGAVRLGGKLSAICCLHVFNYSWFLTSSLPLVAGRMCTICLPCDVKVIW